ncbi:hypothetical protein F1188_00580 [Roseospira marina]|uniref:Uncharacterized protein n=1 Tax=Roseospira marina TaxID=140057 RepID=A0A5M6IG54_9PROT|nr:hypothetical protein [Roseospira marina]KAA5607301.1 hypothetical protein F1188_00580 [Roseospira marina]MBB4312542.1 hypothetical protein [Roseospira marina]MBB5085442.1 hypothetical protein [Roseospira marina]
MATRTSQRRWRSKNHLVKRQLNVMARDLVHEYLDEIASAHELRGKGEAVAFAAFAVRLLMQHAEHDPAAAQRLTDLRESYHRDRELYQG